jgi:hypothetical protein
MRFISIAIAATLWMPYAFAQDPTQTDGDKYKAIFENECVRVLEFRDMPGDKTMQHKHPSFVLYTLAPFERALTLPNGKTLRREFVEGKAMWSDSQTHIGENVGKTPTHVLIVELKPSAKETPACWK